MKIKCFRVTDEDLQKLKELVDYYSWLLKQPIPASVLIRLAINMLYNDTLFTKAYSVYRRGLNVAKEEKESKGSEGEQH